MFIEFSIKDLIDILLVAYLLYQTYRLMKDSGSINIFVGILVFIGCWIVVSQVLEMRLLGSIFDKLVSVGVLALIVLFQDDIRKFLVTVGSHNRWRHLLRFLKNNKQEKVERADIMPIVMACMSMSKTKTGALMVIEKNLPLNEIIRSGETINADVNQRLIENIFFKNSPLHDGAMVIASNKIIAARCILPITQNTNLPGSYGLRHRAGIGITENSDCIALVVSEETGSIRIIKGGKVYDVKAAEMKAKIKELSTKKTVVVGLE